MNRIGGTDLEVFPLGLGGNVFGWTADEATSFAVLDAYTGAGGNFIDTADSYPQWADGCQGGESETIIGRWLARRGRRDDVIIATKVGQSRHHPGLSPATIRSAAEASLRRLRQLSAGPRGLTGMARPSRREALALLYERHYAE